MPKLNAKDLCFENSLILQKILTQVFYQPMKLLEMRKINKRFNEKCLHLIRQFQRKLYLKYTEGENILVNNHVVKMESLARYFTFLTDVAYVKVEEIRTHHLWLLEEKDSLHSNIMGLLKNQNIKVLNGMEEICKDGCADCEKHVLGCTEYGPLQYHILKFTFGARKLSKHFEKLIVSELLIWKIAKFCVQNSTSQAECQQALESILTSRISCDHLQFNFCEDPVNVGMTKNYATCQHAFPREVLTAMIKMWRVKSVGIAIDFYTEQTICSSHWSEKQFFTKFRFDDHHENTRISTGFQLDFVNIDLEAAGYLNHGIFHTKDYRIQSINLIANVRKLFPAKHYYVNKYRQWAGMWPYRMVLNQQQFETILEAVWLTDHPFKSTVTIRYLCKLTETSQFFEIPEKYQFANKEFQCILTPETLRDTFGKRNYLRPFYTITHVERFGRVFKISNNASKCILYLEVYMEKNELQMYPKQAECFQQLLRSF